ncbi:uncharacterized protein [Haliotis cracherodii]|uniref:uncharacterized protein LOC124137125 n=1 Tax=Haliotis rufescens TaxID=6454 RepID=UPI001EB09A3B|nr:uncharacterized protein LOC124137125 [Haliotis rufescens]
MVSDKASLVERVSILGCVIFIGLFGIVKFVLGWVYMNECADMVLLPVYLILGGVISLVPSLLSFYRRINHKARSKKVVDDLWWILGAVFFLTLVHIVAGSMYILVSVVQARVIGRLCTAPWLPPFGVAALCLDWVCFAVFMCVFCDVEYKAPPPSTEPALPNYWRHRHRLRRY